MSALRAVQARQPVLAAAGWAALAVLAASLLGMALDTRTINGVSVWVKPAKFAASFVLWFWTLAWAFGLLAPAARRGLTARLVVRGTVTAAGFEMVWIVFRAARAEPSHFATDPLGALIYGLMGLGAAILVALAALLGVLIALRPDPAQPRPWRHAAALGLVLGGALGGFTGFAIGGQQTPRIGGTPDDAANLPPFFWSRDGGDLRVAHFLAVHAMQALPLLALAGAGLAVIWLGAAGWTAATLGAWALARAGVPLGP